MIWKPVDDAVVENVPYLLVARWIGVEANGQTPTQPNGDPLVPIQVIGLKRDGKWFEPSFAGWEPIEPTHYAELPPMP